MAPKTNSTDGTVDMDLMLQAISEQFDEEGELGGGGDETTTHHHESGAFDDEHDNGDDDDRSISSITPTIKRSKAMVVLVLLIGLVGSLALLILGIQSEQDRQTQHFETRATQLVKDISNTVGEYEVAARSIHNVCRNRETTRMEFRQFYEYLTSGGLYIQAAQCVPNITHAERPYYENETKAFLEEYYPDIADKYSGFKGFNTSVNKDTGEVEVNFIPKANDAPFYFAIHYSEPVVPTIGAMGLNIYSKPSQRMEIERAMETYKPVLGGRMQLVQETTEFAYSVVIGHPGIPTQAPDGTISSNSGRPQEMGNVLIRIPDLLRRRADEQKESIACYLYDTTVANTGGERLYLGSAEFEAVIANGTVNTQVRIPPEDVLYQTVIASNDHDRILEQDLSIASGTWKLVVTPIAGDKSFDPSLTQVIVAAVAIMVAAICLAIFLWRNMRQVETIHHAKNEAEAERKIIEGLFPKKVVIRLLEDQKAKQEAAKLRAKNKGKVFEGKMGDVNPEDMMLLNNGLVNNSNHGPFMGSSVHNGASSVASGPKNNPYSIYGSEPIAELFPETTILFMDLVGFTAWSKSRDPTAVFTLLETLYHAFDMVAKRRRVFKVETVGDCYVAVVGVPAPRKNHAVVMARFGSDCLIKMKTLVLELATTLGQDTADLNLRVGMNSGPVTGGVLRGEKGRFQLFGDSMNTAARMESNGAPGQIHISPSTAKCIFAANKGKWLTEREDRITAKGLGEMTTYWVQIAEASSGTGRSGLSGSGFSKNSKLSHDDDAEEDLTTINQSLMASFGHLSFANDDLVDELAPQEQSPIVNTQRRSPGQIFQSFAEKWGITDEIEV